MILVFVLFTEVTEDRFRLRTSYHRGKRRDVSLLYCLYATEVLQQPTGCALAHSGDVEQFR